MEQHSKHRHLLLVDDEENVLRSLQRVFRRDGYVLHLASSPKQAFEVLSANPIDVVLSDQRMPGETGTEFLSKVKEIYPETVRLMLSGYTEVSSVTDAINEGAIYKFLTKPWDDDQLRANVREAFQRRAMEAENTELHRKIEEVNHELLRLNHVLEQKLSDRNQRIDRDISTTAVMQEMLDHLPLGVMGVDSTGEVVSVNQWVLDFLSPQAVECPVGRAVLVLPQPLPNLIHDHLFAFEQEAQRHLVQVGQFDLQVDIKPMGISSTSDGCLVLLQKSGRLQ